MLGTILYLIARTAWNRSRRRVARLREARYGIGALAGLAYVALTLHLRHNAFSDVPGAAARATLLPIEGRAAAFAGLLLAVAAAVSWLLPFESTLLRFSGAEVALLLPAPMSRRQLVAYRLLRSQLAVLTGALIFAVAYPVGTLAARARGLAGAWMLLMVAHAFFAGVTLARARLRRRSVERRSVLSWLALIVSCAPVLAVVGSMAGAAVNAPLPTVSSALDVLSDVVGESPVRLLLVPYSIAMGPLGASTGAGFARAVLGALLVYGAIIAWVVREYETSETIDGAALDPAARADAGSGKAYAVRRVEIPLAPRGWPGAVFPWKGALQTSRVMDQRVVHRLILLGAWAVVAAALVSRSRGLVQLLGVTAAWGTAFAVLMAPQVLRIDLRQDLGHLDLIKTWPIPGRSVVRAEILWPTCLVSVLAWSLGGVAWLLAGSVVPIHRRDLADALAASAVILVPAVIAVQYTVHNGIAVVFPAWVSTGATRPRGVDAMGQRLILLGATWVILILALLPAAFVAALLWRWFGSSIGPWVLLPSAVVGAWAIWLEVMGATSLLGRALDRLDLASAGRTDCE